MNIALDEHGILEFSKNYLDGWNNFQIMLSRTQFKELKEKIEGYLADT